MWNVAKKRAKPGDQQSEQGGKKPPPSRLKVRNVDVGPLIHAALEEFAQDHSTEVDRRSNNWAARVLLYEILKAKGYIGSPPDDAAD